MVPPMSPLGCVSVLVVELQGGGSGTNGTFMSKIVYLNYLDGVGVFMKPSITESTCLPT